MRALPLTARRTVFFLLVAAVAAPCVGLQIAAYTLDQSARGWIGSVYELASVGMVALLIWCAVYVREEPRLTRWALVLAALAFLTTFSIGTL